MKINKTYRSLLDKSISSMLSAIEIYNKPNFKYREESFAILAVNAWELLFKACILRDNRYKLNSIYELAPVIKKDGTKSTSRKIIVENRCGNPKSISIFDAIERLDKGGKLSESEEKAKMLIATDYARKMALDMRMIDREKYEDHPDNKASHCAAQIAQYYQKYDAQKGTQFVFSDLGTYQPEKCCRQKYDLFRFYCIYAEMVMNNIFKQTLRCKKHPIFCPLHQSFIF